jgi:hypothetical protein
MDTQQATQLERAERLKTIRRLATRNINDRPCTSRGAVTYLTPREREIVNERVALKEPAEVAK